MADNLITNEVVAKAVEVVNCFTILLLGYFAIRNPNIRYKCLLLAGLVAICGYWTRKIIYPYGTL